MPKRVDHDERRREIARAVWAIAEVDGLETVSIRRVAAAAGVSAPLVQHYFSDRDTMLRFAITELLATADARAAQRVAATVPETSPPRTEEVLRAVLAEFLPLDAERTTTLLVQIAYFARAVRDPDLAALFRGPQRRLVASFGTLLRDAQERGETDPHIHPEREIDALLTLAVGLGTEMLIGARGEHDALDLIDHHLARIFDI